MRSAIIPANEQERLEALSSYHILDTLPEEEYDNITRIASMICQTPISLITLIDDKRQWFKSNHGIDRTETSREVAYCSHGLLQPDKPLVIQNALEDERFKDNPLATGDPAVIFYAGIPLVDPNGYALGSLCVIDDHARDISDEQLSALRSLANQVVKLLELRKSVNELKKAQQQLERTNKNLKEFAHVVAHDLKEPLRHINQLSEALTEDYQGSLNEQGQHYLQLLQEASTNSINFVTGVLNYTKAIYQPENQREMIDLQSFISDLVSALQAPTHIHISLPENLPSIRSSSIALRQILQNLISNAIKYHKESGGWVKLDFEEHLQYYLFKVEDNGQGIPKNKLDSIFSLFYMVDKTAAQKTGSTGIGLSIVKKLVDDLGGKIQVTSILSEGTSFEFTIKK